MYEVKQAQIARAIDILRAGPLTAAQFAVRMWADRRNQDGSERSLSQQSHAGHAFLRRIGTLGYVDRIGDLWMVRQYSASGSVGSPVNGSAVGLLNGLSIAPPNAQVDRPSPPRLDGSRDVQADRQRLAWLVGQATEPVVSVSSDAALGNVRIRGIPLDEAVYEACAFVVILGQNANVYPPCGAPQMIVGLQPVEGARALYLRWQQSGQPPDLPRAGSWIRTSDGVVACSGFWRPAGAPASWVDPEDVRARVARQRRAAGLA